MYPLVRTYYTTPAMNTCSKRCAIREIIHTPPPDWMDDIYYLYTLPSWLQGHGQIGTLDTKITNYDLEHYLPVLLANWRDKRRSDWWRKRLEKCRQRLMAVAGNLHMFVQGLTRDGEVQIKVELEEPSKAIKKEPNVTPKLEYPLPPVSPDPNNYRLGSQEIWYKGE